MTGEEFRKVREEAGLTQADVAKALEVTETSIYRWENGKAPISKAVEFALRSVAGSKTSRSGFDVEEILKNSDSIVQTINAWYEHEGRESPIDMAPIFFAGWETFTFDQKLAAVCDWKKALDWHIKIDELSKNSVAENEDRN
jgi:transcriptional regulator with XRE-family HTH domain